MPISFPPTDRYPQFSTQADVIDFPVEVDVTNLGMVGVDFASGASTDSLNPGMPVDLNQGRAVNLRNLGFGFEKIDQNGMATPAIIQPSYGRQSVQQTDWYRSNSALTGVTRDSAGAVLGSCEVVLYTLADLVIETKISDASGNFSFGNPGTGPFYIVAYKVGSPDVAGTTVNTLLPTLI